MFSQDLIQTVWPIATSAETEVKECANAETGVGASRSYHSSWQPRRKRNLISLSYCSRISRIEKEFESSDKRYFFAPCPHCNYCVRPARHYGKCKYLGIGGSNYQILHSGMSQKLIPQPDFLGVKSYRGQKRLSSELATCSE
jgi:hypothetical protein